MRRYSDFLSESKLVGSSMNYKLNITADDAVSIKIDSAKLYPTIRELLKSIVLESYIFNIFRFIDRKYEPPNISSDYCVAKIKLSTWLPLRNF